MTPTPYETPYETKADPLEASFTAAVAVPAAPDPEIAALRSDLDKLSRRLTRPALSATKASPARTAFADRYLRKGLEAGAPELKSLDIGVPADGGFAVPNEIDSVIDDTLKTISPIRSIASVVQIGSAHYRKLIAVGGVQSGWAAETAGRPSTGTPAFVEIVPPMGELYANPSASQAMLDDAMFDVEAWLANEIAVEFARNEGVAFVTGSGIGQPQGYLTYPVATADDTTRTFGTLQYLATGVDGGFPAANPQDRIIDLVHSLRPPYRQGAVFVMNSSTLARVRKMKDNVGNFIWQPGLSAEQPATLLGYPVVDAEAMPDIAVGSTSIAFGNFQAGYLITERNTTGILRDPFSNKPFVSFYAVRRVGGAVINSEAIKLLKFAAA
jgi:HK97 family phage major capsid protein